ncbi:hypothetical protein GCM10022222_58810 [Amycolatopsis ultiminotia]|uniref:FAS1-like dehydratase domain-containing protein n=1 Tax=Amycolatopsis ultiminotia TaxID=543629 RepID=A0ABP6XIW8_9PSEU
MTQLPRPATLLDPALAGRALPAVGTVVSRDRAREFARAIGEERDVHLDIAAARAAGYPDLLLTPTLLFGIELELRSPQLFSTIGVAPADVLHTEQSFVFHTTAHAGEDLVFRGRISSVRRHRAGHLEFLEQDSEVSRGGVPVASLHQVIAVRPR